MALGCCVCVCVCVCVSCSYGDVGVCLVKLKGGTDGGREVDSSPGLSASLSGLTGSVTVLYEWVFAARGKHKHQS